MLLSVKFILPDYLNLNLNIFSFIQILLISLLYIIFMSVIIFCVSIYAKSPKEANVYVFPFTVVPLIASVLSTYMEVSSSQLYMYHVPILNILVVIREISYFQFNIVHYLIVSAWFIVYIIFFIKLAEKLFSNEKVIFRI